MTLRLIFNALAISGAAMFSGVMLAIGVVLGSYWKSLPAGRFLDWFSENYHLIMRAIPLVLIPTLVGLIGSAWLSWGDRAGRNWWLGVWAAGNLARPVEGDWHRRRSGWVTILADRQERDQGLVSHPGNHSSRCIRFRFIAAHIRRHSAFTAYNPRRLKDLNPSTCLIQPNTGSGMVLRRR
jgi:hypothetical protein